MSGSMQTNHPLNVSGFWRRSIRTGWVLLALNSLWTISWTLVFTWELAYQPPPRLSAGFATSTLSPDLYFWVNAISLVIVFLSHFVVAVLLFLRLPNDRMALFVAIFLMAFGTAGAYPAAPEFLEVWNSARLYYVIPFAISNFLAWPLLVAFFALYPDGVFVPGWMRYIALYGFFFSVGWALFPQAFGAPEGWLVPFVFLSVVLVFGGNLFAQVYRYRYHATPLQRQQIKWMVYALVVVAVLTVAQQSIILPNIIATPAMSVARDLIVMTLSVDFVFVPVAVGVAILRYRLFDIDVIIRRTLIYGLLTLSLLFVYFGTVVLLQGLVRVFSGQQPSELITVVSTLAIAALFTPLRRRAQLFIDRRFYRHKYDAIQTLTTFAATARDEVDLDTLTVELLRVVQKTMQPEQISIWLRPSGSLPSTPSTLE